ncbi:MAG: cellulase family glycosylhydrolase [Deltaproteobacteria bacterium]|nr:cellulase family glycosylhydrolase [Deltaproteobacteria bacterium]
MRSLALLALVVGCGDNAAPSDPQWHVRDGFLRMPDGRAAILRGANLSGAQKHAPYIDDKTPADYRRLREAWGFNSIRFLMTWSAVEPAQGSYDDAYLDAVAERMRWAHEAGLAVVLDMHQDIYGEGFGYDGAPRWTCAEEHYQAFVPREPWFLNAVDPAVQACVDNFYANPDVRGAFVAAWRHVAERLAAEPAIVGLDVLNEPIWGTFPVFQFENDQMAPLYTAVVQAVREVAPHWVAFLEPGASRNTGIPTQLRHFDFANVMYSPHVYDAMAEGGGGFDPARRQVILDAVDELQAEAVTLDAGLWIGEYGGQAEHAGIVEYMTAQYDAAGRVAAGSSYWAYDKSDGYGLLAPDGSEKTVLLDAVVRPYPERVAGTPISYGFDAGTFSFSYRPAGAGSTDVIVPARTFPTGFVVDCGDCAFELTTDGFSITTPPAGDVATVTVRGID